MPKTILITGASTGFGAGQRLGRAAAEAAPHRCALGTLLVQRAAHAHVAIQRKEVT
jgi:hypothetical protein